MFIIEVVIFLLIWIKFFLLFLLRILFIDIFWFEDKELVVNIIGVGDINLFLLLLELVNILLFLFIGLLLELRVILKFVVIGVVVKVLINWFFLVELFLVIKKLIIFLLLFKLFW